MHLAQQLEALKSRGFDEGSAQAVVLLREATVLLFEAYPASFVLHGGANLILFHDSLRTSRDLGLLSRGTALPKAEEITKVLSAGLQELGELLGLTPLTVTVNVAEPGFLKLEIADKDARSLFTVDFGGLGSVLGSGIEEHRLEGVSRTSAVTIWAVSRDHLLLMKAEAFLFRRGVKTRDAYDIKLLQDAGAVLSGELENHLADALAMREIAREEVIARIAQVTTRLCRVQLADVLPAREYKALERAEFEPLREAVRKLFHKCL